MGVPVDLSGKVMGIFSVLERDTSFTPKCGDHFKWKCRCNNCGNIVSRSSSNLQRSPNNKCSKCDVYFSNKMAGKTFGKLTVIDATKRYGGKIFWKCKCECGRYKIEKTENLTSGHVKSCGCLQIESRKIEYGLASVNKVIARYRNGAKKRNYEWSLTTEEAVELFKKPCTYCGKINNNFQKGPNGGFFYNGIDRIDNNKGYTKDNCQTLCEMCNKSKNVYSEAEFSEWILNIKNIPSSLRNFREFYLIREEDVSGTSGVGIVARGVIFPKDKKVVLEWVSGFDTITIFGSLEEVIKIHGHDGRTKIIMDYPPADLKLVT